MLQTICVCNQGCVKPSVKVFKYKHKPFTIVLITSPSTGTNFQKVFKYRPKPFVSVINSPFACKQKNFNEKLN